MNVDEECDTATIATLLGDECARTILEETVTQPLSAKELSHRCDVSTPTVYRRLETLRELDLVREETNPATDGNHHKVYTATLDHLTIDLTKDGCVLHLTRRERMADRFTRFIEDMK